MRIKMWGVRGSIPTPGPDTVEFGGNTSCYEIRAGGAIIILDGGTGIRLLGQAILPEMPFEAWMFFSHVHWDHIQGFPFFTPALFEPGVEISTVGVRPNSPEQMTSVSFSMSRCLRSVSSAAIP